MVKTFNKVGTQGSFFNFIKNIYKIMQLSSSWMVSVWSKIYQRPVFVQRSLFWVFLMMKNFYKIRVQQ